MPVASDVPVTESPVPVIGITGHQNLPPTTTRLVTEAIDRELSNFHRMLGVSSLARGTDQIFANVVLKRGGTLTAIVPAKNYRSTFASERDLAEYDRLLERATSVVELAYDMPSEDAYWAAGQDVVRRCDLLLAVWDGQPAGGLGGTADIVQYARELGRKVVIIWPDGASRET